MSDFTDKMHKIRFPLGLRPRPRWWSLQRSPRPPNDNDNEREFIQRVAINKSRTR